MKNEIIIHRLQVSIPVKEDDSCKKCPCCKEVEPVEIERENDDGASYTVDASHFCDRLKQYILYPSLTTCRSRPSVLFKVRGSVY